MNETIALIHFCEQHGPSIVFTTQVFPSTSKEYSWPTSFTKTKRSISQLKSRMPHFTKIHFFSPNSSPKLSKKFSPNLQQREQEETQMPEIFPILDAMSMPNSSISENIEETIEQSFGVSVSRNIKKSHTFPSIEVTIKSSNEGIQSPALQTPVKKCASCSSLAEGTGFFSIDEKTDCNYISKANPSPNSYSSVRTSCVRSLSCEICPGREGPVIFDGKSEGGINQWTLAYVFKIKDSKARGMLRRYGLLFSSSDGATLIAYFDCITNFFYKIVKNMKNKAEILFEKELGPNEEIPSSTTGTGARSYGMFRRAVSCTELRSLVELMDDKYFFLRLHKRFCCILHNLQNGVFLNHCTILPPYQNEKSQPPIFPANNFAKESFLLTSFSQLFQLLGLNKMRSVFFNVLIGNQIILRGDREIVTAIIRLLSKILPKNYVK